MTAILGEKTQSSAPSCVLLLLIWALAAVAILPALFHWPARPQTALASLVVKYSARLVALAIGYFVYRSELWRLPRRQALAFAFLVLLLTLVVSHIHRINVDQSSTYFDDQSNTQWQISVQNQVILLSDSELPHSYRFLPNAIVRWMEFGGAGYNEGRDAYRLIFTVPLFWAIYCYARLYTGYKGAIIALLLVGIIFPISFEEYAGQLADPLSHLSFVLAFIFLATGQFWFLLTTLLLGSLAKETVLAMAAYYVLFHRKDRYYPAKAALLCGAAAAFYFGVRFAVLHGSMDYAHVSGVSSSQISANISDYHIWVPRVLLTAGSLFPFLALGWNTTPRVLRQLTLFLAPTLFLSSFAFSWLSETRNFMPLVFILAVVAGRYFAGDCTSVGESATIRCSNLNGESEEGKWVPSSGCGSG